MAPPTDERELVGDHLRADALVEREIVLSLADHRAVRLTVEPIGARRVHDHSRHRFDAAGDGDVVMAGDDHAGRGEVNGLLR